MPMTEERVRIIDGKVQRWRVAETEAGKKPDFENACTAGKQAITAKALGISTEELMEYFDEISSLPTSVLFSPHHIPSKKKS